MNLGEIRKAALAEINKVETSADLEKIRIKYLGRNGLVTGVLRSLKDLPLQKRREVGPKAQSLKRELEESIKRQASRVKSQELGIDLTAPGRKSERGHLHPLTLVDNEIRRIFSAMNFSVVDGPEVETEYYNFDALNIPADHPVRDMWDTFWLKNNTNDAKRYANVANRLLLRTHTSPVQIRYMEEHSPPFQIIVPGRCFRYEAIDAGHEINFYQLEGLMVGKNISLANFKFVVEEFFKKFFKGQQIEFRYRPSYYPFVEPGLELDVKFRGRWFELMGAGMVHPRVFEYAHYNPRDWQGFAFGIGVDRLAMIKYRIPDIRLFYSGDLRFIRQF